jgi:hypothetical protein
MSSYSLSAEIAIEQFMTLGVSRQSMNFRPMVSSNLRALDDGDPQALIPAMP